MESGLDEPGSPQDINAAPTKLYFNEELNKKTDNSIYKARAMNLTVDACWSMLMPVLDLVNLPEGSG